MDAYAQAEGGGGGGGRHAVHGHCTAARAEHTKHRGELCTAAPGVLDTPAMGIALSTLTNLAANGSDIPNLSVHPYALPLSPHACVGPCEGDTEMRPLVYRDTLRQGECYMLCQMTPGPGVWVGLGQVRVRVQGSNGLGFSKQVAVLTHLSCPVFSCGQRACRKPQGATARQATR